MTSRRPKQFRAALEALPQAIQKQAAEAYKRWQQDPSHPGLHFKPVDPYVGPYDPDIFSIRIGRGCRAICERRRDGSYLWVWIGTHEEYNKMI